MSRILIVEDDMDLCDTYTDFLGFAGHESRAVHSATRAIDFLVDHSTRWRPELIILDLHLPGESGTAVLGFIRRLPRLSNTKVIIVSGDPNLATTAMKQWKANLFLPKPVNIEQLNTAIATLTLQ